MYILDDEKLIGRNDYYLVEKVEEAKSSTIKSITEKSLLARGKVLDNLDNNFSRDFAKDTDILYLADYAIQVKDNIYAVKKDFIVASIL